MKNLSEGKFVLIAEIGVNYYDIASSRGISNMDAAKLMIKEAADAGITAVKFQTYKAGTLAAKASPYYWDITEEPTRSQYELFRKFDSFGYEQYRELKEYSDEIGIEFLSTAFDFESADYLDELMNVYKISSSDLSNIPFIEYQARKNKPILLSVGASNEDEIVRALDAIRRNTDAPVTLLHCVLEYPTPLEEPTEECDVIKCAYNLGAQLVEKHFTLDKTLKGNDHYHAMDPKDAVNILAAVERMDMIRGSGELKCLDTEGAARSNARRSIVSAGFIAKGEVITEKMLTFKRPGSGISPDRIHEVTGCRAAVDIEDDTIIQESMLIHE